MDKLRFKVLHVFLFVGGFLLRRIINSQPAADEEEIEGVLQIRGAVEEYKVMMTGKAAHFFNFLGLNSASTVKISNYVITMQIKNIFEILQIFFLQIRT
jgi:hypothetical protein